MEMLNKKIKQTTINGKEFQIYLLRAGEGVLLAKKLSGLVASFLTTNDEGEVTIDFSKIAEGLSESLSEKDFVEIINKLLKELAVDGRQINFDDYFSGNYGELVQILSFAIQENFGSFFEGLGTLA